MRDTCGKGKSEMNMCSSEFTENVPENCAHSLEVLETSEQFEPGMLRFRRLSSYEGAILNTQMELERNMNCNESNYMEHPLRLKTKLSSQGTTGNNNLSFCESQVLREPEVIKGFPANRDQESSLLAISDSDCSPRSPDSRRLTVDSGIFLCGNDVYANDQRPKQHSSYKLSHVMQAS